MPGKSNWLRSVRRSGDLRAARAELDGVDGWDREYCAILLAHWVGRWGLATIFVDSALISLRAEKGAIVDFARLFLTAHEIALWNGIESEESPFDALPYVEECVRCGELERRFALYLRQICARWELQRSERRHAAELLRALIRDDDDDAHEALAAYHALLAVAEEDRRPLEQSGLHVAASEMALDRAMRASVLAATWRHFGEHREALAWEELVERSVPRLTARLLRRRALVLEERFARVGVFSW